MVEKITISNVMLVAALLTFSGCDKDHNHTDLEKQHLEQLSFTWELSQAKVDGVDVTSAFNNLTFTVKPDKTFTVSLPVEGIWPASGAFTLQKMSGSSDYSILRSDGTEMYIDELSGSILTLQLQYQSANGNNQVASTSGQYEFRFTKYKNDCP
jgi:hypothetical protein